MVRRLLISLLLTPVLPISAATLTVRLDESAVVVSGMQPSGSVLLFGAAHERPGAYLRLVPVREVLADQDGDGIVTYELKPAVPRFSVWLAVDLATGSTATASGEDVDPAVATIQPDRLLRDGPGLAALEIPNGDSSIVALVRPRVGAWTSRLEDGGIGDSDESADGAITASFQDLAVAGGGPQAPVAALTGDIVAVIDLRTLTLSLSRI
jgi:hypothetical protein